MVLATGLYINACAKGEECIPQTWDMFYEKDGFMLIFWNFAGVPFVSSKTGRTLMRSSVDNALLFSQTYCYPTLYMVRNHPDVYKFPLWGNIALFSTLMIAHYMYVSTLEITLLRLLDMSLKLNRVALEALTRPWRKSHTSRCRCMASIKRG